MQMVGGNGGNQFRQYDGHNIGNQNGYNAVQTVGNQVVQNEIQNPEVNANCILMANLQQASTLGTQSDKAPIYDSDGSAEVHEYDNCYNNEIFNIFTQEEQYTDLLDPIPKPYQV
ncbi:hypothetical protein Tco_0986670 [Tanacetum coccineum]